MSFGGVINLVNRCKEFQLIFNGRKRLAKSLGLYEDYRREMLGDISVILKNWAGTYPLHGENVSSWEFKIYIWNQRHPEFINLQEAKVRYTRAFAWYALEKKLPRRFPQVWGWAATYENCILPMSEDFSD